MALTAAGPVVIQLGSAPAQVIEKPGMAAFSCWPIQTSSVALMSAAFSISKSSPSMPPSWALIALMLATKLVLFARLVSGTDALAPPTVRMQQVPALRRACRSVVNCAALSADGALQLAVPLAAHWAANSQIRL